ncbi:MAG: methylenetetrahydrofolate reductase [NAD(P)H] [Armatimonadetes bacterium]|nr:methylenetetrahydrofolate reductase [NAD(P)H] [Armatimonadota bacterium]
MATATAPPPLRVDELIAQSPTPTRSFEFFPPKDDAGFAALYRTIDRLRPLAPGYVSVTYGAGGSTRQKTVDLAGRIQNEIGIRSVAHLTCVGHTKDEIGAILDGLWDAGVRNVLALRGDPPKGQSDFVPTDGGFAYASELIAFIAERNSGFCILASGYPEGHIHCLNRVRDLEHLKAKQDAGASVIVTQFFFDNAEFYAFRGAARKIGITAPIVAGIMPVVSVAGVKRMVALSGARIPNPLLVALENVENDNDAVGKIGIAHALEQCQDLLAQGVDGIHFYTLNRSRATVEICSAL